MMCNTLINWDQRKAGWLFILLVILAVPLKPNAPLRPQRVGIINYSNETEDGYAVYSWSNVYESFEARALGLIEFTAGGKEVLQMGPDAYLSIKQRRGLNTRQVIFEPDEGGNVQMIYLRNSREKPLDAGARSWIREMLLVTYHDTNIGAVTRVRSLYEAGGEEAVLAALYYITGTHIESLPFSSLLGPKLGFNTTRIPKPSSSSEQRIYLEYLLKQDISPEALLGAVFLSGKIINSSSRLAKLLIDISIRFPSSPALSLVLFEASKEIDSSSEHRRALVSIAGRVELDDASGVALAKSIAGISSSSEKRATVVAVIPLLSRSDEAFQELLLTIASISSSSEKRAAIVAGAELRDAPAAIYAGLAKVAGTISSSSERRRALENLAISAQPTQPFVDSYLSSARGIHSSEERQALDALVARGDLSDRQLAEVIEVAGTMSSSSEMSRCLSRIAAAPNLGERGVSAYLREVSSISSSSEERRALEALITEDDLELDERMMTILLGVVSAITSSSEQSYLLRLVV
ncbi:MAG: hypothetical protein V3W14_06525, partial [Candidatus Neomarinimicrobiota bacterium]